MRIMLGFLIGLWFPWRSPTLREYTLARRIQQLEHELQEARRDGES